MQLRNLAVLPIVMSLVFLSACEVSDHEEHSEIQQSTSKGKSRMQSQSPVLKEIFASEEYIEPGQSKDVNHVATKYLPTGSSKKEVIERLAKVNQHYSDKGHIIHADYGKQIHPIIPNPEVMIELKFNTSGYLENIDNELYYVQ